MTRNATARLCVAALLTGVLLTLASAPAWAHGDKAFNLVREAIALMVNRPGDHDAIANKINAALKAEDTTNVQMPLVRQAKDAFAAGDVHQAQRLLEQSIGAQIHTTVTDPVPINTPPPAASPGTSPTARASASPDLAMADMPGRRGLNSGDWVLIVISLAVGLSGVAWAARLRPHLPRHPADDAKPAR